MNTSQYSSDESRRTILQVIAYIEDPAAIRKILNHLQEQSPLDSGL